jgi:L-alanine-DL-glutamate epimerase-like enolase superfamily enzyme
MLTVLPARSRGVRVKISDVTAMVLDTGKEYADPVGAAEAHGVRFVSLLKVTTDDGIVGWSDVETQPHVGRAIVELPSSGQVGFESLRAWLTDLLTAASLHLNAYLFNSQYLEFNVSSASLLRQVCRPAIELDQGEIAVPDGPGLGVEVDEEVVNRYRVA